MSIPRFASRKLVSPVRSRWPADPDDSLREPHLFARRLPYRKLVVMVDAELLDDVDSFDTALLADLLDNELLCVFRYGDDGPPPSLRPLREDPPAYDGWAVVVDHEPGRGWTVSLPTDGGRALSGVMGNATEVARRDDGTGAYADLPLKEAAVMRVNDALAAEVAGQAVKADIYVTHRPYLHAVSWSLGRDVTFCTPREALAAVGFYLRCQGVFQVGRRLTFNRGLYYWVGARELLPEAWRWFSACVQHSHAAKDDHLSVLGGSLLQRFVGALQVRDEIHLALNQPQDNDTTEAALSSLDVMLLFLMGAVDVTAAVAHYVLEVDGDPRRAKWQSSAWHSSVEGRAPSLAAVVRKGEFGEAVLTLLRTLRNAVHGEALQGVAFQAGSSDLESLVGVPARDTPAVIDALERLGGLESWSVRHLTPERLHLDAAVFADRLLTGVVELLNDLMRETPVEALGGVAFDDGGMGPPDDKDGPFAVAHRRSIRLQLGF